MPGRENHREAEAPFPFRSKVSITSVEFMTQNEYTTTEFNSIYVRSLSPVLNVFPLLLHFNVLLVLA